VRLAEVAIVAVRGEREDRCLLVSSLQEHEQLRAKRELVHEIQRVQIAGIDHLANGFGSEAHELPPAIGIEQPNLGIFTFQPGIYA